MTISLHSKFITLLFKNRYFHFHQLIERPQFEKKLHCIQLKWLFSRLLKTINPNKNHVISIASWISKIFASSSLTHYSPSLETNQYLCPSLCRVRDNRQIVYSVPSQFPFLFPFLSDSASLPEGKTYENSTIQQLNIETIHWIATYS